MNISPNENVIQTAGAAVDCYHCGLPVLTAERYGNNQPQCQLFGSRVQWGKYSWSCHHVTGILLSVDQHLLLLEVGIAALLDEQLG